MGGCRCSYKTCKSATKAYESLHFFHYPVKNPARCKLWIENAGKPEFFELPKEQLRNKVVCELHFEPYCFTNSYHKRLVHNAIPTLNTGCESVAEENIPENQTQDVQVLPASTDGTLFTVDTESMQQYLQIKEVDTYIYTNGLIVPSDITAAEDGNEPPVESSVDKPENCGFPPANHSILIDVEDHNKNVSWQNEIPQQFRTSPELVVPVKLQRNSEVFAHINNEVESLVHEEILRKEKLNLEIVHEDETCLPAPIYIHEEFPCNEKSNLEIVNEVETCLPAPIYIHEEFPCTEKPNLEIVNEVEMCLPAAPIYSPVIRRASVASKCMQTLKRHSQEIASLKRALKVRRKPLYPNKLSRSRIISALKGQVPETLHAAVSINLMRKNTNFTDTEEEFLTTLYNISPSVYKMVANKLKWNLPDARVVKQLILKKGV